MSCYIAPISPHVHKPSYSLFLSNNRLFEANRTPDLFAKLACLQAKRYLAFNGRNVRRDALLIMSSVSYPGGLREFNK
jgi:hypothetical protein